MRQGGYPPEVQVGTTAAVTAEAEALPPPAVTRLSGGGGAGLACLQNAGAADAARSDATPPHAPREALHREARGRAAADVQLIGEPPRYEREVTRPVPPSFE